MSAPASPDKLFRLMRVIALLAAFGVLVSSVSLYHHFATSKTSFCDIGQSLNCDLVNRSEFSTLGGVPVALIGLLGYLALFGLATVYRTRFETPIILLIASLAGLAFALRLTYIEARILYAWCILCLSSLATISAIALLCAITVAKAFKRPAGITNPDSRHK